LIFESHRRRRFIANALVTLPLLLGVALFLDPPGQANFWPPCPIHQLFGIDCPGCGATRALAALLHGHLREALRLNTLFVLLLPFGTAGAIKMYRSALMPGSFRWPQTSNFAIYWTVALTALFTVARNVAR
jgi:Protein of unknown function (DUF2752)